MTLQTLSHMSQEHYENEQYDKALKYIEFDAFFLFFFLSFKKIIHFHLNRIFDIIAKSYRKDNWNTILSDILLMSFSCAKHLEKYDLAIAHGLELISSGSFSFLLSLFLSFLFFIFRIEKIIYGLDIHVNFETQKNIQMELEHLMEVLY